MTQLAALCQSQQENGRFKTGHDAERQPVVVHPIALKLVPHVVDFGVVL